jgi:hypothetical protein
MVCRDCAKVYMQCRCPAVDKPVTYGICRECESKSKPALSSTRTRQRMGATMPENEDKPLIVELTPTEDGQDLELNVSEEDVVDEVFMLAVSTRELVAAAEKRGRLAGLELALDRVKAKADICLEECAEGLQLAVEVIENEVTRAK